MTIRELFKEFGELFKELMDFIMEVITYVLIDLPSKFINFFLDTPIETLLEGLFIYFLLPVGIFGIISVLADKYKKK